jgi:hypothetical protein
MISFIFSDLLKLDKRKDTLNKDQLSELLKLDKGKDTLNKPTFQSFKIGQMKRHFK